MKATPVRSYVPLVALLLTVTGSTIRAGEDQEAAPLRRFLYVAVPGIRNYLEFGGHGVIVFDIDAGHKFVRRIPMGGLDESGKPRNVKGICASATSKRVHRQYDPHPDVARPPDGEALVGKSL